MLRICTLPLVEQQLRRAATLAHAAPGTVLRLTCTNGDTVTVADRRLDAQLDPCQLRRALLVPARPGVPRLIDVVEHVEVVGGFDHLGGGLFGRGHGLLGSERWFVSALPHQWLADLFAANPFDLPDSACAARLAPDTELLTCAVRLTATPAAAARLDEIAFWALSQSLVAELLEDVSGVGAG